MRYAIDWLITMVCGVVVVWQLHAMGGLRSKLTVVGFLSGLSNSKINNTFRTGMGKSGAGREFRSGRGRAA